MSKEAAVKHFCVELFTKADTNGDGVIDFEEFKASRSDLSEEESKVHFHLIDINHDGQISFEGKSLIERHKCMDKRHSFYMHLFQIKK